MKNKAKQELEIWKMYSEFSFIEVSSIGRVRTLDRVVTCGNGMRVVKGRILPQYDNGHGYLQVEFGVNGKIVHRSVHRLVAQAFIPNHDNLPEVNHKDNNPANNDVSNLEWCTHEYNIEYREKCGVACNRSVIAVNLKTWETQRFESQHEAGRELGADQRHITNVLKGRYKQTGGYWFTNADNNAVENVYREFGNVVANKVKILMAQTT